MINLVTVPIKKFYSFDIYILPAYELECNICTVRFIKLENARFFIFCYVTVGWCQTDGWMDGQMAI